jgi:iron complex transport system permease protein
MQTLLASSSDRWSITEVTRRNIVLFGMVAFCAISALALGRYPLSIRDVLEFLGAGIGLVAMPPRRYDLLYNLIVEIRLPRVLAASLIGAALASSGAAYQAVFRNPLVSPDVLGVLGGAAVGAATGLLLGGNWALVQALAFLVGLAAAGIGVSIAHLLGGGSIIMLVLGGMISSAFFAALLSIVKYLADPYNQLPSIVYWLMGNLGGVELGNLAWGGVPICAGILALICIGRGLDALSMGDDEARALGVPVTLLRASVIAAATLISALSVSLAGMIGWVGLFVPHFARLVAGPTNRDLMPASAAFGAVFLLGADALARSIGVVEIPIGIVTQLLGIPAFLLVLSRARRNWT